MPNAPSATSPALHHQILETSDLRAHGLSERRIRLLVDSGQLLRVRRGKYLAVDAPPCLSEAARFGGRLDCVSLLREAGIFIASEPPLHVQLDIGASRLPARPHHVVAHWRATGAQRCSPITPWIEALAQACRCQDPRSAIATLDSAWHRGLVTESDLREVFARLPLRYRALRGLLDRRAESGTESLMRLILRTLGCDIRVQQHIAGVGRVDFVVDGWLIVECDSEAHHAGWEAAKRDRRRDIAAATLGYTTIRPIAEDILHHRDELTATLRTIIERGNPVRARRR
ncbi:MAG: hypothetical protein BGO47_03005 [Microbacterium sp. 67-17]|uniref:type IV toxin-antitoxin system AbiEi family antitoxin domain-containing protein n=1 Tax=Microbacterium sp. 67-17 TaxID=1895782 RepID=UPI000960D85B|nr:type IV toxin-antitoxin system AbiEi family antitoxin domain-containing protein [Microbacterium sp. 67-17]OJV95464.1 MAG: hypothetical protein BGO47_03005 [Microbacterium sp. 67-17]